MPIAGENTMAPAVLKSPLDTSAPKPPLAIPAPASPPISACELLDGMPANAVKIFQVIAPTSAPRITCGSTTPGTMMPIPTVFATLSPKNRNAMKLKNAAQQTAYFGGKTRVETIVAIEFAASLSPFMKSNTSATTINPVRKGTRNRSVHEPIFSARSEMFDQDIADPIADVLESVDDFFQMLVHRRADNERHRIGTTVGLEDVLSAPDRGARLNAPPTVEFPGSACSAARPLSSSCPRVR